MTHNFNRLFNWLKTFQTVWLPENIPNDIPLLESIKTKLHEFEQIIIENNEDEEEYNRAKLLNDHSSSNSDIEQIAIASTSLLEHSLNISAQSDHANDEEQARQILLEQSDSSEHQADDDDEQILLRPSIRIKRISQADAERYMPPAWKNNQPNRSTIDHESSKKSNDNEISTTSSTSEEEEDYNIKTRTRSSLRNQTEKSSNKSRQHTNKSHKKTKDIIINYNPSAILNEPTLEDSLTIAEDISPMDEDRLLKDVIENNDNESIFASLDIAQDKPMETNSNDEIQEMSNDEIDPVPNQESSDDRPPIEVPSYSHLLNHSKLSSSDTDNPKKKRSSNDKKNSKRSMASSPNSDATPIKKKSKVTIRQRAALSSLSSSSSSDENENDLTLTARNDASPNSPLTSGRIHIQRSSSSENSNNSKSKRSTRRRKKPVTSRDRKSVV